MQGIIFDIQHYAVHDGPGIRTLVFMKGCPLRCTWCCNPESQHPLPQLRYRVARCTGCRACLSRCTRQVLTWNGQEIVRDFAVCLSCEEKSCVEGCSYGALATAGRVMDADEVVEIVARDIAFYRNSDGGVTFSGGEPLVQSDFLYEMLRLCRERGIHTAVETCGSVPEEAIRKILPVTDLFLYDLKMMDDSMHRKYTGHGSQRILRNLAFLAREGATITVRVPLIHGITDTEDNLSVIVDVMHHNGLRRIMPEPGHSLGKDKYAEFGIRNPMPHQPDCPIDSYERALALFDHAGLVIETAW